MQSLVALGLGLSIVPEMTAKADESDRRVYRPIARGQARRAIVAAWHPGGTAPGSPKGFWMVFGKNAEDGKVNGNEQQGRDDGLDELAERAEFLEALRVSIEEMKAGQGRPIGEMFAEMRQILAEKTSA